MKKKFLFYLFLLSLFCFQFSSFAQENAEQKVTQMLNAQLAALKTNNYESFIKNGNKSFKELFTKFDFETLFMKTKSKLAEDYNTKFLSSIQRTGMTEYLWKFKNKDDKNEHLIRLTLSKDGKYIIGFDFD